MTNVPFAPIRASDWRNAVTPRPTGSLSCGSCDQPNWCLHVQAVIMLGLDAPSVWDHGISVDPWLPHVSVPIMPSFNLWMTVRLIRASTTVLRVEIQRPIPDPPRSESRKPLGFIGEGEGRKVLREMIIDWFEQLRADSPCTHLDHGIGRGLKQAEMTTEEWGKFADAWTRHFFGECIACWASRRRAERNLPAANSPTTPQIPTPRQPSFPPDVIPRM